MDVFAGDLCPEKDEPQTCAALSSLLSLLRRIPAVLWVTDLECRLTSLTGSCLDDLNIDASKYLGRGADDLFPSSAANSKSQMAHQSALQGKHSAFEVELKGRLLQAHVEPFRGSQGAIMGVIGVAMDSTDRLVADRAMRLSEQNYRSLIEEVPYAICRSTLSGQLLQVNHAMVEMLRYDSDEELLLADLPLIFTTSESFLDFQDRLLARDVVQGFECCWLRSNGEEIQVHAGGRVIRNPAGEALCLDLIAENVTERKLLEAQLRQAQKMQAVGQLAGGIAHDFNNLLTVIQGQAELLLSAANDARTRGRLEEVSRAAERAGALTRQLLAFSRKQVLQSKVLDLNSLISNMTQLLTRLIGETIEFSFLPGTGGCCVKADPNQIEQAIMNLVVNARDAMPQGGRLRIETRNLRVERHARQPEQGIEPGDYVLTIVQDSGIGMDRETQSRIFEPFFTTKKLGQGTGLGLSTVYGIVQQSGGSIHVESAPGAGSAFKIYLPRVAETATPQQITTSSASPRGHETILLVEDEEGVRELVAMHLQDLGYRVLKAADGISALQVVQSNPVKIDLLLSDLVMPRMGGQQLVKELRKQLGELRVILVSGYPGDPTAEQNEVLQGTAFLAKPFSMKAVAQAVRQALDSPAR